MDTTTNAAAAATDARLHLGVPAGISAFAWLLVPAIALLLAATLVIGGYAVYAGARGPGVALGEQDYGQRHPAAHAAARSVDGVDPRLDDYGIRCRVVGWCSVGPGAPQLAADR